MIVDAHTHIWDSPEQLGKAAADRIRNAAQEPWRRPCATPEAHAEAMKPVDHAFVLGFESAALDAVIPASQIQAVVRADPRRNFGFVGIDPLMGGYVDRVDEAVELGLSGVVVCPAATGCHPTHTRAMRLYEKCVERKLPLLVHMGTHFGADAMMEFSQPFLFDEVARSFPDLPIIIAQVGHPWVEQTLVLIGKHRKLYADLSHLATRQWHLYNALLSAYQQNVISRLVLGSDFPFCTPEQIISTIYSINTFTQGTHLPSVPREHLRLIVERDTLSCLGISPRTDVDDFNDEPPTSPVAGATNDEAAPADTDTNSEPDADASPSDATTQAVDATGTASR